MFLILNIYHKSCKIENKKSTLLELNIFDMDQIEDKEKSIGEMKKRRVIMEDGKRYLIYYTFDEAEPQAIVNRQVTEKTEEIENV